MPWRDLLYLVRRNLQRMKLRVAMTAIGVLIGTAAIILLVSLGAGLQRAALQSVGSIGELTQLTVYSPAALGGLASGNAAPSQEQAILNDRTLNNFRKLPGVVAVTPMVSLRVPAMLRLNRLSSYANITGIEPNALGSLDFQMESGMARLGKWQVIIGARLPENFQDPTTGKRSEEPVDLQGQTLQLVLSKVGDDGKMIERIVRLRVVGVLASSGGQNDYTMYLSLNDALELNAWASGRRANLNSEGYDQALVKVSDPRQVAAVEQAITQQGFIPYSAQTVLRSMNQLFLVIQIVLGGIGGIALLVAGFGIANAMIMAIYERTREIGLMKAVGARNRDVMFVFLGEAGFIGTLGGVGGVALGWVGGLVINFIATAYISAAAAQSGGTTAELPTLVYTPVWLMIFSILFSTMIGVASGIYPALRATRLDPIAALRYE